MYEIGEYVFLGAILCLLLNIIVALAVLIYTERPPPKWIAYPVPPLMLCMVVGLVLRVVLD